MEWCGSIIAVMIACVCVAADAQKAIFTTYSIHYRYGVRRGGIFLLEAASNSTSSTTSDIIAGSNLWRSELYASQNQDGSGVKAVLRSQLLNREQASRTLGPGGTLKFSTPLNISLSILGSFPYLCLKLSKDPSARPFYQFVAGRDSFLLFCRSISAGTQSLQTNPNRNSVDIDYYNVAYEYEIQPATGTYPKSVQVRSVEITARVAPTSIDFSGANTWQAKLFVAEREDGSGLRGILANQLLNTNQASTAVFPGKVLRFTANQRFNLDRYGPGTSFPYLCTEFTALTTANVDVRFGNSPSAIYCGTITAGTQSLQTNPNRNSVDIDYYNVAYEYEIQPATGTYPKSVQVRSVEITARVAPTSIDFSGANTWQAKLFVAEREDGSGLRGILANQLLNTNQASTAVFPGKVLRFTANQRFNLDRYGPGTSFPYLCTEFTALTTANVDVRFGNSPSAIYCGTITAGETYTPESQAEINTYDAEISLTRAGSDMVVANILYIVYFGDSTSTITGNALWQLRLYASENPDGTGQRRLLSPQLLNRNQISSGVGPGGELRFEMNQAFRSEGLGPDTSLSYICLAFNKHPQAAMEFNYQGSETITSCEPIPRSVVQRTSRAVVRRVNAEVSVARNDPSSTNVTSYITYVVQFDTSSDAIHAMDDSPLWRLRMFASQTSDGAGPVRILSNQLLDGSQVSAGVRPNGVIRFITSESFDSTGLGPGTPLPFICLTLEKYPSADFEIVFRGRNVITGCQPLPDFTEPTPRAVVERSVSDISFSRRDPSSPYVDAIINYDLTFAHSSNVIDGDVLWQLRMFASQYHDGTGDQRTIVMHQFDENEMSAGVTPGGQVRLTASESFDSTGLGPGTPLPFICLTLEKHPSADFKLVFRGRNVITECRALPVFAVQSTPRAVVTQSNAHISLTRDDPSSTYVMANVNYLLIFGPSSDVIDAMDNQPLWQLRMFASQNSDGTGPAQTISYQLLDESQVSTAVRPGGLISFRASESFDSTGLGPGTPLPYICLTLEKHPRADFELVFRDRNVITGCRALPVFAVQSTPRAVVTQSNAHVSFTRDDPSSTYVMANVNYLLIFGTSSDVIDAMDNQPLWQLRMFASQNSDGTGPAQTISYQLLDESQVSTAVRPGGLISFRASESFNSTGLGPGTPLPYICLTLEKYPSADFELVFRGRNVITGCRPLPDFAVKRCIDLLGNNVAEGERFSPQSYHDPCVDCRCDQGSPTNCWSVVCAAPLCENFRRVRNECCKYECLDSDGNVYVPQNVGISTPEPTPRAVVERSVSEISFSRRGPSSPYVDATINYNLTFSDSSNVIDGDVLWQLRMFASQYHDGTGDQRTIVMHQFDENEMSAGVTPGGQVRLTASESFDSTGLGPGTPLPFICLTLEKDPSADFELVFRDGNVITGCQPLPVFTEPTPRAVVERSVSDISFSRRDPSSPYVEATINYDLTFSDSSTNVIDGDVLWQLRMFASQYHDGTGDQRTIVMHQFDENEMSAGVTPGGQVRLTASESFDSTGLGPGTPLPYICLTLEKHPSADFKLVFRDRNVITGCQPLPVFAVQSTPRAVVTQSNPHISFTRDDPSSTYVMANVNYLIIFGPSSDVIDAMDSQPLWQLRMFASQNSDGTGPAQTISYQLLDESQVSAGVRPGGLISFRTSESFDSTGLGPGTPLPYICLSLEKNPRSDFELVVGDSNAITRCRLLPQFTQRAVVEQSASGISFSRRDRSSPYVDATVNYNVTFADSSDVIDGDTLWQLRMFASQYYDGTGSRRTIVMQLLDENQVSAGVRPGGQIHFTASESVDIRGIGTGTRLPYICLSLQKQHNAEFEIVFGDKQIVTGCREMSPFEMIPPDDLPARAIVDNQNTQLTITPTDSSNTRSIVNINMEVTFDETSDEIDGNTLWQLRFFASEFEDGSGDTQLISAQLLNRDEIAMGIRPGGRLLIEKMESFDTTNLGPGTQLPYVCVTLNKHPGADFQLLNGESNIVTSCEPLPVYDLPARAIVDNQNTQLTITPTDSSNTRSIVNINMEVTFDETSDEIDGNTLWQFRFFASEFEDGSGDTQLISAQLLNRDEIAMGIRPGGHLLIEKMESFDTTNLGPGTQLPYVCVTLNKHPGADFQLLNGESNFLTSCEPLPVFQEPEAEVQELEAEETKTCRLWGDPHQKTFDGYGYSFQGEAEYVAVKTCKDDDGTVPEFQIIAENFRRRPSKQVTYIRELKLEYSDVAYALVHPNTVTVDGVVVTLPFSDGNGVNIHTAPPHKILTTNFGLVMRLDNEHNSDITLPVRFANKVCGICGNFDGIRGNECHYQNGTSMELRNEECKDNFTQAFIHNTTDPPPPYREHIKPLTPCGEGSALLATADDKCNILMDPAGPLATCHPFVSPDFYYETCVFDLCQLLPSAFLLCGHVEAYILECSQVTGGTVEVGYWRNVTEECELHCGEGMTFTSRGNPCPPTCAYPDGTGEDCPFPFLETCQCDEGTVLDGTRCVNVNECGCQMDDGRYLSIGEESMSQDCAESCLCTENRELECSPVTCAAYSECAVKSGRRDCYCQTGFTGNGREECGQAVKTCRIYGDPHFSTFDEDFYSFQGDCFYTAVRTCKKLPRGVLPFQIHINNDALVPGERYTYTTLARFHYRGKIYRIPYSGIVTVERENIANSLPFRDTDTGVEISKYENSILLHTDGGIHMNFTLDNELTIKLPPVYFGKVCGLCGNADGNSTNDKQLPDGTLGKKLPFANSWAVGSCTPMDEPVESCVVGSDEEIAAIDICSDIVRKDGPFAYCHDFRDPTHFYESCVYDLCATLPSTELFCVSANQYLQACAENGGSVKGDWKKEVEYCSSVDCPDEYTPFRDSCYRFYRTKKNFEQSKKFCSARGGHLATVTSRAENDFISRLAQGKTSWIGGERNHSASFQTYTTYGNDTYTFLPNRIPKGVSSIRFGVTAQSNAYIILSPTRHPDENTPLYEFAIGSNRNKRSFVRRCMSCPEEDFEEKSLLKKDQEKRFFINFQEGVIMMGRYKNRDINLHYRDESPILVQYVAFKTVGPDGTWKFYDNEFMWITNERWSYDNYRFGEPSNYNNEEHCLETNYDSNPGIWNDHFCSLRKSFVCEVEGE